MSGIGALRKLLVAAMAGIRDVIDDAVRILSPTQRRPRMSGLAAGSAFRLVAQAEDAFLLFLVGRRFRESVARRRLAAVSAERIQTEFEFPDPLLQGHDQFPQLPNLLGHGGVLGLDLGQLPAAGGIGALNRRMLSLSAEICLRNSEQSFARPSLDWRGRSRDMAVERDMSAK